MSTFSLSREFSATLFLIRKCRISFTMTVFPLISSIRRHQLENRKLLVPSAARRNLNSSPVIAGRIFFSVEFKCAPCSEVQKEKGETWNGPARQDEKRNVRTKTNGRRKGIAREERKKGGHGRKGRSAGRSVGRFASARLHGVTRKYGAPKASRPVQRGHNVSIRESSLEGPRGYVKLHTHTHTHTRTYTTLLRLLLKGFSLYLRLPAPPSVCPPCLSALLLLHPLPLFSSPAVHGYVRWLLSIVAATAAAAAAPFCESVQQFAKGVPHTGPHRSPRYLNDQIFQFGIHHGVERNHRAPFASPLPSSFSLCFFS